MSILPTIASGAGFVRALVQGIVTSNTRQIVWPVQYVSKSSGPITAPNTQGAPVPGQPFSNGLGGYVALLEDHRDELIITEHPVEQGSVISDHAFKLPARLTLQIGWSSSSPQASGLPNLGGLIPIPTFAGFWSMNDNAYIKGIYKQLLQLQAQRTLLDVYTGKRNYKNMLLHMLSERTTPQTENSLIITAGLQEIIIAKTTVVRVSSDPNTQKAPETTAPTAQQGQQQLQPAPNFQSPPT